MSSLGGELCKVPCQRRVLIGHSFKPSREMRPLAGRWPQVCHPLIIFRVGWGRWAELGYGLMGQGKFQFCLVTVNQGPGKMAINKLPVIHQNLNLEHPPWGKKRQEDPGPWRLVSRAQLSSRFSVRDPVPPNKVESDWGRHGTLASDLRIYRYTCTCVYEHTHMNLHPCKVLKSKKWRFLHSGSFLCLQTHFQRKEKRIDRGGRKSVSSRTWEQVSLKKNVQALA